jgi:WD40 repeat protein
VASEDQVTLWSPDLLSGTKIFSIDWHVCAVAAAPAGAPRVVVAGQKLLVLPVLLDSEGGASTGGNRRLSVKPLEIPITDSLNCVAWSPDGRRFVCGSRNGEASVYEADTGARVGALVPHAREVVAVGWSPDRQVLLTADEAGLRLSDAKTLAVFDEIRPGWTIADVAVSPAGDLVAIAGCEPSAPPQRTGRLATLTLPKKPER